MATDNQFSDLRIPCDDLPDLLAVDDIIELNKMITEPDQYASSDATPVLSHALKDLDTGRQEDYHHPRNIGVIETLLYHILPHECEQDNRLLWLATVIMEHIAQHQAFGEGNKRTAYLASSLFLLRGQITIDKPGTLLYPMLDASLTKTLGTVAIGEISRNELFETLADRLSE